MGYADLFGDHLETLGETVWVRSEEPFCIILETLGFPGRFQNHGFWWSGGIPGGGQYGTKMDSKIGRTECFLDFYGCGDRKDKGLLPGWATTDLRSGQGYLFPLADSL